MRTVTWTQGESNSAGDPNEYSCLQQKMISEWRKLWGDDFGFIYTQLSTWTAGGGTVCIRMLCSIVLCYFLPSMLSISKYRRLLTSPKLVVISLLHFLNDKILFFVFF